MDYELAKELKEARFPAKQCPVGPDCEQWWYWPGKEAMHVPTLEEFIEACGDMSIMIGKEKTICLNATNPLESTVRCDGKTPREAVARLWMALNKK